MRLPRRVPWSDTTELDQLCTWIYADANDPSSKVIAINRLSAWKASTRLPHALEATLSLLIVISQDERNLPNSDAHTPPLVLRQSYAIALIRFVNGLVDPLQQGNFARSIATIATQIGLPAWLVELRHASTHEELPSLELLREGARDAMSWLLHNYFLPTLSPANRPANPPILSPLSSLLAQYKSLLKITTRDVSLKSRSKPELVRILHDFENWISEAKVVASMASLDMQYSDEDERVRWALEHLCDALVGRGGLVPVSKRKRPSPSQPLTTPTPEYISLWSPLILHLHSRFPTLPSILLSRILKYINSSGKTEPPDQQSGNAVPPVDVTYNYTLGGWALWIVCRWEDDSNAGCDRAEVLKELLIRLGLRESRASRALVSSLVESNSQLGETVELLTTTINVSNRVSRWEGDSLNTMSSRLSFLQDVVLPTSHEVETSLVPLMSPNANEASKLHGWKQMVEGNGWKPCPIGVFFRS